MASQTEENYLKALFSLADSKTGVKISELGKLLKVSLPTVNSMVRNLEMQGLIHYEKYKPVSLTPKGRKAAAIVLRKHRLTEMFLVERMGFGWEEVHEIAEQVEHIDSTAFFQRMDELLGFPKIDPHGSPIPDKHGHIIHKSYAKLSTFGPGDMVVVRALSHDSADFLKFLNSRELTLNTEVHIQSIESFDGSMVLSYPGHPAETFSKVVCDRLLAERQKK